MVSGERREEGGATFITVKCHIGKIKRTYNKNWSISDYEMFEVARLKTNKRYNINQENWFITVTNIWSARLKADKCYNTDQTF